MLTRREASAVFVSSVMAMLIILFWIVLELTDWKSVVLVNTKRIRASSIDGYVQEKSYNIYEMSVSGGSFKPKVVARCEVEF